MNLSTIFRNSTGKHFALSLTEGISFLTLSFVIAAAAVVSGWGAAFSILLTITAYAFLFYIVRVFYCRVTSKEFPKLVDFLRSYLRKIGMFTLSLTICVTVFVTYQNEISPAQLPEYTISNGEKTVRFRTMAHIGSESFYSWVRSDLVSARKDGYSLFYEGVRPGSPENEKKFDAMMGFKFDKAVYPAMSKLYGLVPQDMASLIGTPSSNDRNVDVSIDDIVAFYEKRHGSVSGDPITKTSLPDGNAESQELVQELVQEADSLNDRELVAKRYLNRAIMSLVIKNRDAGASVFSGLGKADVLSSILEDRNRVLVDAILSSDKKKIFVMYGLLHFDGVFDLLQERDPRWQIAGPVQNRYPTLP